MRAGTWGLVCVCVPACLCMCGVRVGVCVYTWVCVSACGKVWGHVFVCLRACGHVFVCMYVFVYWCVCMRVTGKCVYVCVCMSACVCIYVCAGGWAFGRAPFPARSLQNNQALAGRRTPSPPFTLTCHAHFSLPLHQRAPPVPHHTLVEAGVGALQGRDAVPGEDREGEGPRVSDITHIHPATDALSERILLLRLTQFPCSPKLLSQPQQVRSIC